MSLIRDLGINLLANAGYDLAKDAKRWVTDRFAEHRPEVIQRASENVDSFLIELAARIRRLEEEIASSPEAQASLTDSLKDPDVAATLQSAVLAAARTSSSDRHVLLADMVKARLRASAGNARAVASNLAVEMLPRLASSHVELLGLLTVIYFVRPTALIERASRLENAPLDAARKEAEAILAAYEVWLGEQLDPYRQAVAHLNLQDLSHLAAASCVTLERSVRRQKLHEILAPHGANFGMTGHFSHVAHQHPAIWWSPTGWLLDAWNRGLSQVTPTPSGLLIGCGAHGARVGGDAVSRWEWADASGFDDGAIEDELWDGDRIKRSFVDAIEEALEERESRRVPSRRR